MILWKDKGDLCSRCIIVGAVLCLCHLLDPKFRSYGSVFVRPGRLRYFQHLIQTLINSRLIHLSKRQRNVPERSDIKVESLASTPPNTCQILAWKPATP